MEYDPMPPIDLLVIDEFYKLSLRRIDERADTLNNAFLKIVGKFRAYLKTEYSCAISTKSKWKRDGQKQERTQQAYHIV